MSLGAYFSNCTFANTTYITHQNHFVIFLFQIEAREVLYNTAKNMVGIDPSRVLIDLGNYVAKSDIFKMNFLWDEGTIKALGPADWWKGLVVGDSELKNIAMRILQLPGSSAGVERSFKTYSNTHTKNRNRLTNDRAGKVVYIAHNSKLMDTDTTTSAANASMVDATPASPKGPRETTDSESSESDQEEEEKEEEESDMELE